MICGGQGTEAVRVELSCVRAALDQWYRDFQSYSNSFAARDTLGALDKDKRHDALGFGLTCRIVCNRLLFALCPSSEEACEREAQDAAAEMLQMADASTAYSHKELFLPLKMHVAKTTRDTAVEWAAGGLASVTDGMLAGDLYIRWCRMNGWTVL